MAYTTITLTNPNTGAIKQAPIGFSWTVLFFGFFPPLFRNDWKFFLIFLICGIVTWGFSSIILSFFYNKWFIKGLIGEGFKIELLDDANRQILDTYLGMEAPLLEE